MRTGLERHVKHERWGNAAASASNLSELELTLGELANAVSDAVQSVTYADQSKLAFHQKSKRGTLADTLHQAGRLDEAGELFREAETMQAEYQPDYPLLYSLTGFRYCDLLLVVPERAAWKALLGLTTDHGQQKTCNAVAERAAKIFEWRGTGDSLLDIALDYLTLGRAAFYASILEASPPSTCQESIQLAIDGLRRAGVQHYLPLGLLTLAWLHTLEDNHTGPDSAQADLDEALEIAERGPMPLFMADIHLHRARLFFRTTPYPWHNPDGTPRGAKDDLAEARRLIEKHGYWRRKEELEDAERVIGK